MRRRLRHCMVAFLAAIVLADGDAAISGELSYSQVNHFDIQMLTHMGRPEEAVEKAQAAIAGLRPTDNPVTLRLIGKVLSHLCEAQAELGEYEQAEAACLESLATFEELERTEGGKEPDIFIHAIPQLARVYEEVGNYEAALELRQRQLQRTSTLREGNLERVRLLTRIGDLYQYLGQFATAEATYLEAIAADAKVQLRDRGPWLSPQLNLATLYLIVERFDKAEETLNEGMVALEKAQAEIARGQSGSGLEDKLHSIQLSFLSQSLAKIYYHQKRFDEARQTARHVLAFYEDEGNTDFWFAIDVKVLLARIENAEDQGSPEAHRYLESAVASPQGEDGASYAMHAIAQKELAQHYLLLADPDAAEPLAREALETLAWILAEDNYQAAAARVVLARVLQQQGRLTEAVVGAQRGYAAQRAYLPPYHSELGETLALLAELYEELGQDENLAATETLRTEHRAARATFKAEN